MQHYQIFSSLIAVIFFIIAFILVRRDTINPASALRWAFLSVTILIVGLFPQLTDKAAKLFGVGYAPIIPVLLACIILLLKALLNDIERTKDRVKIDRLVQKVAMLEQQVSNNKTSSKS